MSMQIDLDGLRTRLRPVYKKYKMDADEGYYDYYGCPNSCCTPLAAKIDKARKAIHGVIADSPFSRYLSSKYLVDIEALSYPSVNELIDSIAVWRKQTTCKHQWETFYSSISTGGPYWFTQCVKCDKYGTEGYGLPDGEYTDVTKSYFG